MKCRIAGTGPNIRAERARKGWSRSRLAAACGLSYCTLHAYETGLTDPTDESLGFIALALGVPVSCLLPNAATCSAA